MATKILLILSAVVTAGALFLGIQNRKEFVETRGERNETNASIKEHLREFTQTKGSLEDALTELKSTTRDLEEKMELVKSAERDISSKTEEVGQLQSDIDSANAEILAIEQTVRDALGDSTVDEVKQKVDDLEKEVAEAEQIDASLQAKIDTTNRAIANNRDTIKNFKARQTSRTAAIARNSLEASITAVDQEWGFVVINAGSNRGIEPDSQLLVRRGDENIGKLTIVSIEKSQTIADIVMSSVASGGRIVRGDKVIFEKPRG
jgi:predicted  nucleic acid-binding Zn-ribbon protein